MKGFGDDEYTLPHMHIMQQEACKEQEIFSHFINVLIAASGVEVAYAVAGQE